MRGTFSARTSGGVVDGQSGGCRCHQERFRQRRTIRLGQPGAGGLKVHFSLRMPGAVLGTPRDVLVHCLGRVVRCSMNQSNYEAAATIDEYQFVEQ